MPTQAFGASDGVAAYGMIGVVIIGVVFGVLLSLANKIVTPGRLTFAATVSIPFLMQEANIPLLTGLVTGGGLFMVAMIAYGMPQPKLPRTVYGHPIARPSVRRFARSLSDSVKSTRHSSASR
ncbi:hypothetical protein MES5069_70288 [Mesorhizobium escarrei]|uniref:Uncharacterized protein n=1 Tax=Mesorhizobium escarrei TaxID=666018 RepID=A0ABM9EH53_9HYPH|nr:hypothetical protein MES5069_70288 [Mesorhizobium escarrei]